MTCDPNTAPRATGPGWELRQGRWQDALADVESVDALIVDAPYSERTHSGQRTERRDESASPDACLTQRGFTYAHWSESDVAEFVASWGPRTRGWFVSITDSELYPHWRDALRADNRYVFAPLPCVVRGMGVRLAGDGPSNWTTWAVVARPSNRKYQRWGTLDGSYVGGQDQERKRMGDAAVHGGKPLWLMRALVRDYTRPGDLVCDPCAGGSTTLLAAVMEGRRAIGSEMDPAHYEIGRKRLERGFTVPMFAESAGAVAVQQSLLGDDE